jgi:ABC-type thiamin/hydroxymethylpyrimidine transport system permease subunit
MNQSSNGFVKHVVIATLIVIVIASYPVSVYANKVQVYSIISGFVIGLLNALIGYKLNSIAFTKPNKSFMAIVFGGMGLRMLAILILLLILLYIANLDEITLIASVFFFYVLYAAIEIIHLNKAQSRSKQQNTVKEQI